MPKNHETYNFISFLVNYDKLSYFTNQKSAAIWGWFPILTIIPVRSRYEVTVICPYKDYLQGSFQMLVSFKNYPMFVGLKWHGFPDNSPNVLKIQSICCIFSLKFSWLLSDFPHGSESKFGTLILGWLILWIPAAWQPGACLIMVH